MFYLLAKIDPGVLIFTILATTFSLVALVSLWAATSPASWIVRSAAVFGLLTRLLLVPAYEPFAILFTQALTVILVIAVTRFARQTLSREKRTEPKRLQFSITTLLALTTFVAIAAAIIMRLPRYEWRVWGQIVLDGVSLGWLTLLVAWLVYGRGQWWVRLILVVPCIGAIPWLMEYANDDLFDFQYWAPDEDYKYSPCIFWGPRIEMFIVVAVPFTALLLVTLLAIQHSNLLQSRAKRLQRPGWLTASTALLLVVTVWVPLECLIQLQRRYSAPAVQLPVPNGHDDFVAAAKLLDTLPNGPYLVNDPDQATTAELRQAVALVPGIFDRALAGLGKGLQIPFQYESQQQAEEAYDHTEPYRRVREAFDVRGQLARHEQRWFDAAHDAVTMIRIEFALSRGGPWRFYESWGAISQLMLLSPHLSSAECLNLTQDLIALDALREPLEPVLNRHLAWAELIHGWNGRLGLLIGDGYSYRRLQIEHRYCDGAAQLRLLAVELAIHACQLREGQPPASLSALVPDYLPAVPIDPFSPTREPLRLTRDKGKLVCYSVGSDQKDGGGIPPTADYSEYYWPTWDDIRLDVVFFDAIEVARAAQAAAPPSVPPPTNISPSP